MNTDGDGEMAEFAGLWILREMMVVRGCWASFPSVCIRVHPWLKISGCGN